MFHDTATTMARLEAIRDLGVQDRDRRLRHRLLVARLPPPVPRGHPQDRARVRRHLPTTPTSGPSPSAIVALGRTLGLTIVAEGIEIRRTARSAARARLRAGQGYLFGRPSDAETTYAFIADGGARRRLKVIEPADAHDPRPTITRSSSGRRLPEPQTSGDSMFILYAVVIGLVVGLLLGGRAAGLADMRIRWPWAILVGGRPGVAVLHPGDGSRRRARPADLRGVHGAGRLGDGRQPPDRRHARRRARGDATWSPSSRTAGTCRPIPARSRRSAAESTATRTASILDRPALGR